MAEPAKKYSSEVCSLENQWKLPEGSTSTESGICSSSFQTELAPLDLYQKPAAEIPICWNNAPSGNEKYFSEKPILSIENLKASIVPREANVREIFYVLTTLGPILTYSYYLGHNKFRVTQRFQSGSDLTVEAEIDARRNVTIIEAKFTDRSGFAPKQTSVPITKLEGRALFSFSTPGAPLVESFTVVEPRQGDVATNARLLLAPNQPENFFQSLDPETIRRFVSPTVSTANPQAVHAELEMSKGLNLGDPGTLRKWLIYLDNGDVVRVLVEQHHTGRGSYEVQRAWVFHLETAGEKGITSIRQIDLTAELVSLKGGSKAKAANEPTYQLIEKDKGAYPYSIRFQLTATDNGSGDNRVVLTNNVLVEQKVNRSVSREESHDLANHLGLLDSTQGILLEPTPETLRLMSQSPTDQSATLRFHGEIGGLIISPEDPLEISGSFTGNRFIPTANQSALALVYPEGAVEPKLLEVQISVQTSGNFTIVVPRHKPSGEKQKPLRASIFLVDSIFGIGTSENEVKKRLTQIIQDSMIKKEKTATKILPEETALSNAEKAVEIFQQDLLDIIDGENLLTSQDSIDPLLQDLARRPAESSSEMRDLAEFYLAGDISRIYQHLKELVSNDLLDSKAFNEILLPLFHGVEERLLLTSFSETRFPAVAGPVCQKLEKEEEVAVLISRTPEAPEEEVCEEPDVSPASKQQRLSREEADQRVKEAEAEFKKDLLETIDDRSKSRPLRLHGNPRDDQTRGAISLVKGHPYNPELKGWVLAIEELYDLDKNNRDRILWRFLYEYSREKSEQIHYSSLESMATRALAEVFREDQLREQQLTELKKKSEEKEKKTREETKERIEALMRDGI